MLISSLLLTVVGGFWNSEYVLFIGGFGIGMSIVFILNEL